MKIRAKKWLKGASCGAGMLALLDKETTAHDKKEGKDIIAMAQEKL